MVTPTTRSTKRSARSIRISQVANVSRFARPLPEKRHTQERYRALRRNRRRQIVARFFTFTVASLIVVVLGYLLVMNPPVSSPTSPNLSVSGSSASGSTQSVPSAIVITINGDQIDEREFVMEMGLNRANIIAFFTQKYGVTVSAQFWTTPLGSDGTPLAYLKAQTQQQVLAITVQQGLARKYGLVQDISYRTFLQNLQAENAKRVAAEAQQKVVYGPIQYDVPTYFNDLFSNLVVQLKQLIKWPQSSQQDLYQLYLSVRDQEFLCTKTPNNHLQARDCTSDQQYQTFRSVQNTLVQLLNEKRYTALVTQKEAQAQVQVDTVMYGSLTVN